MSPTPDSTLADPQQIIADLKRQLAESDAERDQLRSERDEALEQQTATAEVLQVINSSPGDLAPVFDAMLEKTLRLCEAAHGNFLTYDGEVFHQAAFRGEPQFAEYRRQQGPLRPAEIGQLARVVQGRGTLHRIDAREDEAYRDDPAFRQMVDGLGIRTSLTVPLRKGDALLGAVRAYRREVRPFTDKQIALVENFAAQAVIAMENARLITETREALEQQTATAEVLQVINSSPGDLAPVFDAILEKAHSLCGADRGALVSFDGEWFRAIATRGMPEAFADHLRRGFPCVPGRPTDELLRGEPVHTLDLAAFAADSPPAIARLVQPALELAGTRTILMVPLCKDGALLGYIAAYRLEVRSFTDKQIALLQNFAAQAVIAMENARLLTETREALEQQTATAEVLGVINSSPGDLGPVFDAMLERALGLCEASFGVLRIYDGEQLHLVAMRGVPDAYAEFAQAPITIVGGTAASRIRDGEDVVSVPDLSEDEGYRIGAPAPRALVHLGGARSYVAVALRKDAELLGTIGMYRQEVRPFTDKQIALLQNFAAQAVIAMENARLLTETREALEQQTATAEVLGVINASPGDLAPVFNAILEKATRLCEAPFGVLRTWDGERFHLIAAQGDPKFAEWAWNYGPWAPADDSSPAGRIVRGEEVVRFADAPGDEARSVSPGFSALVEASGMRSGVTVALRKDDTLRGTVTVFRREVRPFTDKQVALLQSFGAQAAIAIENARLLGELRQRTDEVGELNRDLEARVAEQVDELGRVGRLKRFLAPQLAELIVSHGDEKILESHRREIVVVFCDLRGYTAFTETAEPEEVLDFLRQYHGALGPLVSQFEGTLDQFSGDGIMVFFNDPVPCPDPAERAVKMAMAMREAAGTLIAAWRRRGRMLGFGAGIAQGYATLGQIGFSERSGYTAIGTVCNLAARLCAEAKDGQILIAQLVAVAVEETTPLEEVGELTLKGLTQPVVAYNVPLQAAQPALRVIEGGGPQTV
jgi:GAF domain-containing protein